MPLSSAWLPVVCPTINAHPFRTIGENFPKGLNPAADAFATFPFCCLVLKTPESRTHLERI
jgi:hypothetical protein